MSGISILASDSHGIFIPQYAASFLCNWDGVTQEDIEILNAGPDHEHYWYAWEAIERDASYTDEKGNVWRLYQDGDLWAYCEPLMTDDEYYNFFGGPRLELDTDGRWETDNWYDTSAELY
jgi:hypothetical protein